MTMRPPTLSCLGIPSSVKRNSTAASVLLTAEVLKRDARPLPFIFRTPSDTKRNSLRSTNLSPVESLALAKYFGLIFSSNLLPATLEARPIVGEDRKEGVKLAAEVTRPQLRRSLERAFSPSFLHYHSRKINLPTHSAPLHYSLRERTAKSLQNFAAGRERCRVGIEDGREGGVRMWTFWNENTSPLRVLFRRSRDGKMEFEVR